MSKLYFLITLIHSINFHLTQAQQPGKLKKETQPPFKFQDCSEGGKCTEVAATLTMDANWRWTHDGKGVNCYTGQTWNEAICKDGKTCAEKCTLEGADYAAVYGVTAQDNGVQLKFATTNPDSKNSTNFGSRLYPLDASGNYHLFKLKNRAISFEVDLSKLPCGTNGALYLVSMDKDGGMSKYPSNKAGARFGTGYCDAQCPQDVKWIGGKANSEEWVPSKTNPNAGKGKFGSCCMEMDLLEANSIGQSFTPHVCSVTEETMCSGKECGKDSDNNRYGGLCDKDGCDFASERWGVKGFYGKGMKVDTSKKFTVTTMFVTEGNKDDGKLVEIRRTYAQDGKEIKNEPVNLPGLAKPADSVTQEFCSATKKFTGDKDHFGQLGGLAAMDKALAKGMVMAVSLWDDDTAHMAWLDGTYPPNKPADAPGVYRGPCKAEEGTPAFVRKNHPDSTVQFSNFKIEPIKA